MRKFRVLIPLAGILLIVSGSCKEQPPVKPNIIFIFSDDHSYNSLEPYGNEEVHTPNLQKLADQGVCFTHAYNMGAWNEAVCIASRTMLNTGRMVWRAFECEQHKMPELLSGGELWSQIMKKAGYETYYSGKWHVMRVRPEQVFDHMAHFMPGMAETLEIAYNRPIEGQPDPWSPYDKSLGGHWQGGKHWSEVLADDAIGFIDSASLKETPFFMYLAFCSPHDPRQSPKEYVDMYPEEQIKVPESFLPEYPYKDAMGCGKDLRDERLAPFPRTEYAIRVHRSEYYGIISFMDTQIGRILDALEKSGKADNTYIFYTSDQGLAVGNHGLMGKQNMFDHSIRSPLIVVGPDLPRGKKLDMDVYLQDIMPTCIGLAGAKIPEYVEFHSLLPLLEGRQKESSYDAVYGCYMDKQRMIRKDNYKLIAYPNAGKLLLYDLMADPLELNDLSGIPGHEEQIAVLYHDLLELCQQMGDTLKLDEYFPDL